MIATRRASPALLVLVLAGCSRQGAPMTPANATERAVLALAATRVPNDWTIPLQIAEGPQGVFRVTYWTPEREMELLGPREAIVKPAEQTVEIVLRC